MSLVAFIRVLSIQLFMVFNRVLFSQFSIQTFHIYPIPLQIVNLRKPLSAELLPLRPKTDFEQQVLISSSLLKFTDIAISFPGFTPSGRVISVAISTAPFFSSMECIICCCMPAGHWSAMGVSATVWRDDSPPRQV